MEQGDRDKPTNRRKEQKEKKNEKSAEEKKLNRSCMVQIAQSLSLFLSLSLTNTHTHIRCLIAMMRVSYLRSPATEPA